MRRPTVSLAAFGGLAALTLLAGCATATCDPTTAGFIGGLGCQGARYDLRTQQALADQQAALQTREQAANAAVQASAAAQLAVADEEHWQQRVLSVRAENVRLRQRLADARNRQALTAAQLHAVERQIAQLEDQARRLPAEPDPAALRRLEEDQKRAYEILRPPEL
jgi:hypothetical protein